MPSPSSAGGGRGALVLVAALGAAALTACSGPQAAGGSPRPAASPDGETSPVAGPAPTPSGAVRRRRIADPVRLRVPAIGVSTRVIALGLDRDGRLIAPERYDLAGWNRAGPEPGEPGVSVIAGHVDSRSGPAVFYRLPELRRGDRVHVDGKDGTTVTFTVRRLARYPKDAIPDEEVYGSSGRGPELRLITCGGAFDRTRRSYRDNVVVFLEPAET